MNELSLESLNEELLALILEEEVRSVRKVQLCAVAREHSLPLSFAQQRLWFLDQFEPGNAFYNVPAAVRLVGQLNVGALTHTFNEIVRRHEALRTTFATIDDTPVQVIAPMRELPLPLTDLSDLPPAEREARAQWLAQDEAQTPFDLSTGPLIRAGLLRLADTEHIVLFTVHHIVSDGWSMGVLVNEIATLYAAYAQNLPSPLAELPIQYADFAHWQRQWLSGAVLESQLGYWKEQLAGAPTLLALPTDRPRPAVQSYRGATLPFTVAAETVAALVALSQQTQTTLFMTLAAAFNVLLARYAGQSDICIGTPIANRNRAEIESLIGFFVNTLVLRTQVNGNVSFTDLLRQVRTATLDAYSNQDVPFEHLVEVVNPERHTSHAPLFQVMLALQNTPMDSLELPGLSLQPVATGSTIAKFDLTLNITEGTDRLFGSFEYNTDLFDPSTIERMAGHFTRLLEAIVADPACRTGDLTMLSTAERTQLLVEWNNTATDYPKTQTIHQLFEAQVERNLDAVALVFEEQQLTYGELNAKANQLAHHLHTLGVGPDILVGICVERSIEMIVGLLGILKAGGAYVPLDPAYPKDRLAFMLDDSKPAVLLTQQHLLENIPVGDIPSFCLDSKWETLSAYAISNPAKTTLPGNLAYVIYTSGSTGKPKGVLIAQRHLAITLLAVQGELGFQCNDIFPNLASNSFDISLLELMLPLTHGGITVLLDANRVKDLSYLVEQTEAATFFHAVPSLMDAWLDFLGPEAASRYPALRYLLIGGEAVSDKLVAKLIAHFPRAELVELYGPTEATMVSTFYRASVGKLHPVLHCIGKHFDGTQTYLLDTNLNPVPVGVAGELHIAGDGLARGYLNRPDLTAEKFIANPFSTVPGARMYKSGDLARYLPDGNIEYLGRIDHQVKIRGFRIELGEIEAALTALPEVREAVVLAREDEPGDKRLVAYLMPHDALSALDVPELRSALAQSLPDYMVPAHFIHLDHLPLTPNGKIDRKALPAPEMTRNEIGYVAPRTPTEEILAGIWAEVLKLDRVGVHDNFFELGGHSLLATQAISKLHTAFHIELPLRALFESPTVESLSHRITLARQGQAGLTIPTIVPVSRSEPLPLSFAQQRLWFLDQFEPGNAFYNVPAAVRLVGQLNVGALTHTFNEIVRRHEALRTTFATIDDTPVQVIAPMRELPLPLTDLSDLPPAEREARAQWLAQDEAQTPFDLSTGPLIRAGLLRLADTEHIVLFTVHHIVSDGWSMGVLVNEIATLYAAYAQNLPSPLAELPIQYADFAHWQRQWLSGAVLESQLGYWKEQLAGAPTLLALPTDRPRPAVQSYRGATLPFTVAAETVAALVALSQQTQTTLFMTLAAAFNVLLARYAGQSDICIGTPIANRNRAEIESLIGFFVNTLVLRTQVNGNVSFTDLLRQVRTATLDAYSNQDVPFEHLVEVVNPERHTSHAPLFQVMLALQNTPMDSLELPGLSLQPVATGSTIAKFDLTLNITEGTDRLFGSFEYNTDLFDPSTIERMAGHFTRLLEAIVADPACRTGDLTMLSTAERTQLLVEWNNTATDYPKTQTIHQLFEAQVERNPDAVALVFEEQQLTYGELNAKANQLAHHLHTLGVGPDILVGICVERSIEMIVGLLGILKAGGAYVPLDPAYPKDRLAFMLDDSKPAVLLTQQHLHETIPTEFISAEIMPFCLDTQWMELAHYPVDNLHNDVLPDNLAYVIYTSGSTGKPKGVLIAQQHLVITLLAAQIELGFSADDSLPNLASCAFDISLFELILPLIHGGTAILLNSHKLKDLAYLAEQTHNITFFHAVPSFMNAWLTFLGSDDASLRYPALRYILVGGEAVPDALLTKLATVFPHAEIAELYGPTEATMVSTFYRASVGKLHPVLHCIGKHFDGTQTYLLDTNLNPVPVGVAGELHIAGDGLARGYLNRPDLTAEKFIANPFGEPGTRMYKSGDLARYLPDGNIEFLGRIDHQVKIRGFRIELGEIEAALAALPSIRDVVVLAREDIPGEKRLVAYLVPHDALSALDVPELRSALAQSLPDYMVPAHFTFLDHLPLTSNGKIDRHALPAPDMLRSDSGYVAPRNSAEETLAIIWASVLKLDRVGIHDNFFELGGHSLLAVTLLERMRRAGFHIAVRTLFASPTLAELAAVAINADDNEVDVPSNKIPTGCRTIAPDMLTLVQLSFDEIAKIADTVPGGAPNIQDIYPLVPLQEGILFHHLMSQEGDPYILPTSIAFDTYERLDRFLSALQTVIERHDILRTAVLWEGLPEPVQVVWRKAPMIIEEIGLSADDGDIAWQLGVRYDPRHYRINLKQAPLLHGFIAQDITNERWLLHILAHHLVSDHTALELLIGEIQTLLHGQSEQLPMALPFRNFVAQARLGVSQAEHEVFFKGMLSHVDEPTAPFGLLNVQGDGSGIEEASRIVESALAQRIRQQARKLGVSAASIMHLAWAQVLSNLTGQKDVVFGTVLFGRMQGGAGADRVLGMFINTLPVCFQIDGRDVAQGVHDTHALLAQLLRHEHTSLALAQRCSSVVAPTPLFSALLNYRYSATTSQDADAVPGEEQMWEGIKILGMQERTNYPLVLSVDDLNKDFTLTVQVNVTASAQRLCDYMHTALEHLVEALDVAPMTSLNQIDILPLAERHQLLVEWNDTATDYPRDQTIHQLFEAQVEQTPHAVAVVFEGDQLTYAELNARANQLAHHLRSLGVGPDILVGICVERSLEMIVGLLGILKAGGAYLPLDPAYPKDRLAFMLDDAKPYVLLTQQHLRETIPTEFISVEILPFCLDTQWMELAHYPVDNLHNDVLPDNLAYVIYTSGSTGKPKGACIAHSGLSNYLSWSIESYPMAFEKGSVVQLPLVFDATITCLFTPIIAGKCIQLLPSSLTNNELFDFLKEDQEISLLKITPAHIDLICPTLDTNEHVAEIGVSVIGGEALTAVQANTWHRHFPASLIVNEYGPTETVVGCCVFKTQEISSGTVLPIGRPIANTQIHILDANLNPVPIGIAGELHIAGDGLARGYLNRPDLTAEKFIANPFSTVPGARMYKSGDLAHYLPDGNIEYLGRIDHQVKIRGFRIELGEIEAALTALPEVREAVVLAREDEPGDKRLVAYLMPHDALSALDVPELRSALAQSLPDYMVPAHFIHLDHLPLTPNGKIDRKALPAPEMTRNEIGYVAPRTPTEEILAGIWAEVLKLDRVGVHDNFFELGGHSLLATQVISKLRATFQIDLPLRTLFEAPTISKVSVLVEQLITQEIENFTDEEIISMTSNIDITEKFNDK